MLFSPNAGVAVPAGEFEPPRLQASQWTMLMIVSELPCTL